MSDNRLYAKSSGTLSTDLTELGTDPYTLVSKEIPTTVNAAATFPTNLQLKFERGGYLNKTLTGAINFLGNPFKNHTPPPGIFRNFAASGITFAGEVPPVINTEWWDNGTNSLIERLTRAVNSVPAGTETEIHIYPRTIDSMVKLRYGRKYLFKKGHSPNTWAGSPVSGVSAFRREPFIYSCPEDEWITFEWEDGAWTHLSATVNNAGLFYPADDELYTGKMGHIKWINPQIKGNATTANAGGLSIFFSGNCEKAEVINADLVDVQDYHATMGGDSREGNFAENVVVKGLYSLNSYNYKTHTLNVRNGLWEDIHVKIDTLLADHGGSADDDEPNIPDDIIENVTTRNYFFETNQGTADVGAGRPYNFSYLCFTAQGAATDGIKGRYYYDCRIKCRPNDINSVIAGRYAEGVHDLVVDCDKYDGGMAGYLMRFDRCRKVLIKNPSALNGYSGEIKLKGCAEVTIELDENAILNPQNRIIREEEFGHPVLVNGTNITMLDHWVSIYGRPYAHYVGLTFDMLNQDVEILTYTGCSNFDTYPFKKLTSSVSAGGSKSVITMSSFAGNVATNTGHNLYTGEPVDYDTTGTPFTAIANLPYTGSPTDTRRLYAIRLTANTYSLATSIENAIAGTAISLAGGSGTHTIQPFYLTARAVVAADIDHGNDRIPFTGHNLTTGSVIQYRNYGGTEIGGLFQAMTTAVSSVRFDDNWFGFYYVITDGADHFKLAETKADALANNPIPLANGGTGTHYFAFTIMSANNGTNRYSLPADYSVVKRHPSASITVKPFGSGVEEDLTNFALDATVTASSEAATYEKERAVDGLRHGNGHWGADTTDGKAWKSNVDPATTPQWLELDFGVIKPVQKINVFFPASSGYDAGVEPSLTDTSTTYNTTNFKIQANYGGAWVDLATETGNNKRRKEYMLSAALWTDKVRIYATGSTDAAAYVTELEVWG